MNDDQYQWGTQYPSGNVCEWDSEEKARTAHQLSRTFPGGPHALVRRKVSKWEKWENAS